MLNFFCNIFDGMYTKRVLHFIYTSVFAWQPFEIRLERRLLLPGYVIARQT